jgi:hypothetical protein
MNDSIPEIHTHVNPNIIEKYSARILLIGTENRRLPSDGAGAY